jgi:hypothetical protein
MAHDRQSKSGAARAYLQKEPWRTPAQGWHPHRSRQDLRRSRHQQTTRGAGSLVASVEDEDPFEAALDKLLAQTSKRRRPLTDFLPLPDRGSNNRHQRETRANIACIVSTARLILKAHEFDNSTEGAMMRLTADRTIELWTMLRR